MDTFGRFNTVLLNTLLLAVLFISDKLKLQYRIRIENNNAYLFQIIIPPSLHNRILFIEHRWCISKLINSVIIRGLEL